MLKKAILVAAVGTFGAFSSATLVTLHADGYWGGTPLVSIGAGPQNVVASTQFLLQGSSTTPFEAFCTDVNDEVANTWTANYVSTADYATAIQPNLSNTPFPAFSAAQLDIAASIAQSYGLLHNVTSAYLAAEYQVAIWDVLYPGAVTSSNSATLLGDAASIVAANGSATNTAPYYVAILDANGRKTSQDFMTWGPAPSSSTPEPFSLALGAGALGLAIRRRRLNR